MQQETQVISIRLPKTMIVQLDAVVEQALFRTRTELIGEACRDYIARFRRENPEPRTDYIKEVNKDG